MSGTNYKQQKNRYLIIAILFNVFYVVAASSYIYSIDDYTRFNWVILVASALLVGLNNLRIRNQIEKLNEHIHNRKNE